MSSKGRGASDYVPDPKGFYETQPQVTRAGMSFWNIQPGMSILQPGCGSGAIAKVLRREYGDNLEIIGVEIDKVRARKSSKARVQHRGQDGQLKSLSVYNEVVHMDFFDYDPQRQFDFAIENPAFPIWLKVSEKCFTLAKRTSLLIPWNAAASKDRAPWWRAHPGYSRVLNPRPSFARSVKCAYTSAKRAKADGAAVCSFQEMVPLSDKHKTECPLCGAYTMSTTTDSNEYSWTLWAPEITKNCWDPLDTPPPNPDDQ